NWRRAVSEMARERGRRMGTGEQGPGTGSSRMRVDRAPDRHRAPASMRPTARAFPRPPAPGPRSRLRLRRRRTMSRVLPPPRFEDPAVFGRVAVLMGGTTSEREVSLDSGRNVLAALRARGVDANGVDGIANLVRELQDRHFDRVFNILH